MHMPGQHMTPPRDPKTDPRVGDMIRVPLPPVGDAPPRWLPLVVEGLWDRWGEHGVTVGSRAGRTDLEVEFGVERWTLAKWSEYPGAKWAVGSSTEPTVAEVQAALFASTEKVKHLRRVVARLLSALQVHDCNAQHHFTDTEMAAIQAARTALGDT